jgi:hypothetical protein
MAKRSQGWVKCEDRLPYCKDSTCSLPLATTPRPRLHDSRGPRRKRHCTVLKRRLRVRSSRSRFGSSSGPVVRPGQASHESCSSKAISKARRRGPGKTQRQDAVGCCAASAFCKALCPRVLATQANAAMRTNQQATELQQEFCTHQCPEWTHQHLAGASSWGT